MVLLSSKTRLIQESRWAPSSRSARSLSLSPRSISTALPSHPAVLSASVELDQLLLYPTTRRSMTSLPYILVNRLHAFPCAHSATVWLLSCAGLSLGYALTATLCGYFAEPTSGSKEELRRERTRRCESLDASHREVRADSGATHEQARCGPGS